jgi:hypothetical protein
MNRALIEPENSQAFDVAIEMLDRMGIGFDGFLTAARESGVFADWQTPDQFSDAELEARIAYAIEYAVVVKMLEALLWVGLIRRRSEGHRIGDEPGRHRETRAEFRRTKKGF